MDGVQRATHQCGGTHRPAGQLIQQVSQGGQAPVAGSRTRAGKRPGTRLRSANHGVRD
ncbi:hypothetical protein L841_0484 [Mycobacterium sp. MAC_080597_8934]|nr:hypothetical protein L839_3771 [Mycobacterium avium MAV_120809_2495]ETZ74888.1 hypothetical protein L841_0484 [Mycobacterium sp. MAC_080597_8934]